MNVPGHDGKKGFGGACFPKDTVALAKSAEAINQNLKVLEAAIKSNNTIRKTYTEIDSREKIRIFLLMIKSKVLPRW